MPEPLMQFLDYKFSTPDLIALAIFLAMGVYYLGKSILSNKNDENRESGYENNKEDDESGDEDKELMARISAAATAEELISMLVDYEDYDYTLVGKENRLVLEKARSFDISKYGWAVLCHLAKPDSELEKVAEEKAGDLIKCWLSS